MSEAKVYPVPAEVAAHAWINNDQYLEMYKRSVDDPEGFWAEQAQQFLSWDKPWDKVLDWDFTKGHIRWFEGGKLNVSHQLPGSPPGDPRRPNRRHLGGRQPQRRQEDHLQATARRCL
jgi:hypothetical protein